MQKEKLRKILRQSGNPSPLGKLSPRFLESTAKNLPCIETCFLLLLHLSDARKRDFQGSLTLSQGRQIMNLKTENICLLLYDEVVVDIHAECPVAVFLYLAGVHLQVK
jgi:hypothetical protein